MESVTVTRRFDADPEEITAAMEDVEAFVRAAGFDEVAVDGPRIDGANEVGPVRIELALEVVERSDATLAYEQREGIFEAMTTRYGIDAADASGTDAESELSGTRARARP